MLLYKIRLFLRVVFGRQLLFSELTMKGDSKIYGICKIQATVTLIAVTPAQQLHLKGVRARECVVQILRIQCALDSRFYCR